LTCRHWKAVIIHCSCHITPSMEERTDMTTAQGGYTPVHRWVKHVLGHTHTGRGDHHLGGAVSPRRATRHLRRSGPRLTGRAHRCWSVVSAAGAALVERAGPRSGPPEPGLAPCGAALAGARPGCGGGAGHHAPRAVGSLAGRDRQSRSHAPDGLGRPPLSLAHRTLPCDDAGPPPAGSWPIIPVKVAVGRATLLREGQWAYGALHHPGAGAPRMGTKRAPSARTAPELAPW
jgi:hypothetical protein